MVTCMGTESPSSEAPAATRGSSCRWIGSPDCRGPRSLRDVSGLGLHSHVITVVPYTCLSSRGGWRRHGRWSQGSGAARRPGRARARGGLVGGPAGLEGAGDGEGELVLARAGDPGGQALRRALEGELVGRHEVVGEQGAQRSQGSQGSQVMASVLRRVGAHSRQAIPRAGTHPTSSPPTAWSGCVSIRALFRAVFTRDSLVDCPIRHKPTPKAAIRPPTPLWRHREWFPS